MTVTEFDTDLIVGEITSDTDGVLLLTVPDDGGWRLYIDGEEAEIIKAASYFCSAPITAGTHEIRMVYTVPGIVAGGVISGTALVGIAAYTIALYIKRRRRTDKLSEGDVEAHHDTEA